jgi:xanthine dehydrogenase accessory factor
VSGGCVEGAVIAAAKQVMDSGEPRTLDFGVSDELAWEVGLPCGGQIQVFVNQVRFDLLTKILDCRSRRIPVLTVTCLTDGAQALVTENEIDGDIVLDADRLEWVRSQLGRENSFVADWNGKSYFLRLYPVPIRLLIVGAVHIAQSLATIASMVGFKVIIIDPRRAFAAQERFPDVDLVVDWPDGALPRWRLDSRTALVVLSHDPKLDDPALALALASDCFYIGALGSTRTHAKRIERLSAMGLAEQTHRIHGPVGLDLGGRAVSEIAVAILAQIIQQRYHGAK